MYFVVMKELININNVTCFYDDKIALNNIFLKINEGDSLAVLGSNGSGKSTLLKLIAGLIVPAKGEYCFEDVLINDEKIKDRLFLKSMHKKIGFLFQNVEHQLFCTSVYDEIAFGPRQIGIKEVELEKRVNDCLSMLNIEHLIDRVPYQLSEGEKKKVALAAVLAINPDILVLDEPFNGLDRNTQLFMVDFIRVFSKAGKTVVCALHDINGICDIFTRVIAMSPTNNVIFDGICRDFDSSKF
jgi:cobalt/nickel transport system ATP-binding protein